MESTRLTTSAPDFATAFARFVNRPRAPEENISAQVRAIIEDVRTRGDEALIALTKKYDKQNLTRETLAIEKAELESAAAQLDETTKAALDLAAERITAFHEKQKPQDVFYKDEAGVSLGARWRAVDAAGLYVPGGAASYPSSVLMNVLPARVAGVERLVMATPMSPTSTTSSTPTGKLAPSLAPALAYAALRAGVQEAYRIGGAQAIAALAFGTQTISAVDMITGPGNAYVSEAKRQLYGVVGIDMVAGPSEILVVAENKNDPAWIAYDLLSQAEHDPLSQSILICDDAGFADKVSKAVETALADLPRAEIARASWQQHGAIVIVEEIARDAPALINQIAPEHLELALDNPQELLPAISHAGAIFLGRHTPEAIGDYMAGPNHILPTNRTARYASGLAVGNFMKRSSLIGCDEAALARLAAPTERLAQAEGLHAHARSISIRNKKS